MSDQPAGSLSSTWQFARSAHLYVVFQTLSVTKSFPSGSFVNLSLTIGHKLFVTLPLNVGEASREQAYQQEPSL